MIAFRFCLCRIWGCHEKEKRKQPMKITKLQNGLTILYEHNKVSPIDTLQVYVSTGSILEEKHEHGITHLVEHLMFKSTKKRTSDEITRDLETCGARVNAWTSFDATCFYFDALPENVEKCTEIYADMLMNKQITPEEFKLEKSVVCQEIAMYDDDPASVNEDNWFAKALGWESISGKRSEVSRITLEQANKFIKERYAPQNITVSVCTHLSYWKMLRILKKNFGEYTNEGAKVMSDLWAIHASIKQKKTFTKKVEKITKKRDTTQVQLCYSFPVPKMSPLLLEFTTSVLARGLSSVLTNEIREKRGLCYDIHAAIESITNPYITNVVPFLLKVVSSTESKHVKEFTETLPNIIRNAATLISETDLQRIKNINKMKLLSASTAATHNYFCYCHPDLKMKSLAKETKKLRKLTLSDVRNVFAEINKCKDGNYSYSMTGQL